MSLLAAILIALAVALVLLAVLFVLALAAAGSRADDARGYDDE